MSATTGLPRIFTVAEVAEYLGCDPSTVYRAIGRTELRSIRVGQRKGLRVTEDALRAYLEGGAA